jgi:CDP-ribitol ribitolphosphotransferase
LKAVLFCVNPYAFGILKPLHDTLLEHGHQALWYIHPTISQPFPYTDRDLTTNSLLALEQFDADAIFTPGNEVPHYLKGVKVQVFHGMAGEKKGHFRIRHYFDLYLTQGPYFTRWFEQAAKKFKDFYVTETGWCKLDPLFKNQVQFNNQKRDASAKPTLLYAPTFSPALTSAIERKEEIFALATSAEFDLLIKFHDLMAKEVVQEYVELATSYPNVTIIEDRNILPYLVSADVLISDTSSVVYEFLLLNKPVITINTRTANVEWKNLRTGEQLLDAVNAALTNDIYKENRKKIISEYHPYTDGNSSLRMIQATQEFIKVHGVPTKRKLSFLRRYKITKRFGKKP